MEMQWGGESIFEVKTPDKEACCRVEFEKKSSFSGATPFADRKYGIHPISISG